MVYSLLSYHFPDLSRSLFRDDRDHSSSPNILLNSLSSPTLSCLALISAFLACTSLSFFISGRDFTAWRPDTWDLSLDEGADFIGDLSWTVDLPFRRPGVWVVLVGLATLKLDWKSTLSREEALPKGSVVGIDEVTVGAEAEEDAALGTFGKGLEGGLTVACILASDEAVGA
jgi:hypothetical protein